MITLVFTFFDNPAMLIRQATEWNHYAEEHKKEIAIIVVDDCSRESDAAETLAAVGVRGLTIEVYRVQWQIPWNQDGCRNLAMQRCRTEWAFMTDIDHVLPRDQVHHLLSFRPQRGEYYMPIQLLTDGTSLFRPHPNSYLMHREDYWSIGGYDEDFAGYYGSDGNFRGRAKGLGLREVYTGDFKTVVFRTQDIYDANTKGLGRKNTAYHVKSCPRLRRKSAGGPYVAQDPVRFEYERTL